MANHPNRRKIPGEVLVYIDGAMQRVTYVDYRSTAGRSAGPEYEVAYQLADGSRMCGTRHTDRGNLMTGIRYLSRPHVNTRAVA